MGWMWFGSIGGLALFFLLVWALTRAVGPQGPGAVDESPETILKRRYARGEVNEEEYKRRLADLRR